MEADIEGVEPARAATLKHGAAAARNIVAVEDRHPLSGAREPSTSLKTAEAGTDNGDINAVGQRRPAPARRGTARAPALLRRLPIRRLNHPSSSWTTRSRIER